jgi:hypothetical protein
MIGFGTDALWLNVTNAILAILTVVLIVPVLEAVFRELWTRIRSGSHGLHNG